MRESDIAETPCFTASLVRQSFLTLRPRSRSASDALKLRSFRQRSTAFFNVATKSRMRLLSMRGDRTGGRVPAARGHRVARKHPQSRRQTLPAGDPRALRAGGRPGWRKWGCRRRPHPIAGNRTKPKEPQDLTPQMAFFPGLLKQWKLPEKNPLRNNTLFSQTRKLLR